MIDYDGVCAVTIEKVLKLINNEDMLLKQNTL